MFDWMMMLAAVTASPLAPRPIVIAHRGASADRPEHTIAAYTRAIEGGADYIEPDLVVTSDGILVARHENEISGTTDVADHAEFSARRTTKIIDGTAMTGWFTEDFTLAELKTLRARERLPQLRPANTAYDAQFAVPTFDEVLTLAQARGVGVYPEIKHGTYFLRLGLAIEPKLLATLKRAGLTHASDKVFIQSFEVGNLQALRKRTRIRLVQLMAASGGPVDRQLSYADMAKPAGLKAIARYANAIGVDKGMIIPRDAAGISTTPTTLVADAHAVGLQIHAWTFRPENAFLPLEDRRGAAHERGRFGDEITRFVAAGIDGLFSDDSADAVRALANRPNDGVTSSPGARSPKR